MAKFQFIWLEKHYYIRMIIKHLFDPFVKVMYLNHRVLVLHNQSQTHGRFESVEKALALSKIVPKGVFIQNDDCYILLDGYVVKQEQLDQTQIQFYQNLGYEMVGDHTDLNGQKITNISFKKKPSVMTIIIGLLYMILAVQMTYFYLNQPPTRSSISEKFLKIRPFIKDHIDYMKITDHGVDIRPKSSFDNVKYRQS